MPQMLLENRESSLANIQHLAPVMTIFEMQLNNRRMLFSYFPHRESKRCMSNAQTTENSEKFMPYWCQILKQSRLDIRNFSKKHRKKKLVISTRKEDKRKLPM